MQTCYSAIKCETVMDLKIKITLKWLILNMGDFGQTYT